MAQVQLLVCILEVTYLEIIQLWIQRCQSISRDLSTTKKLEPTPTALSAQDEGNKEEDSCSKGKATKKKRSP